MKEKAMNDQYRIEDSSDSKFKITRIKDDKIISPDVDDPDFCKFLEWASTRKSLDDTFVANEHTIEDRWSVKHHLDSFFNIGTNNLFFCIETKVKFYEYLRERSIVLHVASSYIDQPPEKQLHKLKFVNNIDRKDFTGKFCDICKCGSYNPIGKRIEIEPISNVWLSDNLCKYLNNELKSEVSETRKHSLWSVRRAFLYIDISDYSQLDAEQQSLVIHALTSIMSDPNSWADDRSETIIQSIESYLCIGDGYIVCFDDSLMATHYAVRLANKIEESVALGDAPVEYHYRMSVHVGKVYHFWDKGRKGWNYTGDGINDGKRVLEAIGTDADDIIFISGKVKEDIIKHLQTHISWHSRDLSTALHNRGRKKDKHDKMHRVYEVNHSSIPE